MAMSLAVHWADVDRVAGASGYARGGRPDTRDRPQYDPCRSESIVPLPEPIGEPLESAKPISRCGPVEIPTIPGPTELMTWPAPTWVPTPTWYAGPAWP